MSSTTEIAGNNVIGSGERMGLPFTPLRREERAERKIIKTFQCTPDRFSEAEDSVVEYSWQISQKALGITVFNGSITLTNATLDQVIRE